MSTLTLVAVPTAAGCTRAFLRRVLTRWGLAHLAETAELLASELVANAVAAVEAAEISSCGAPAGEMCLIQVRAVWAGSGSLFVGVWDPDVHPPTPAEPGPDDEGGRGLLLVDHLSTWWGWRHSRFGGKVVWFELRGAAPTTASGLPLRTPAVADDRRLEIPEMVDDVELLRRVLNRLRALP